ncbi:MAG: hypothetical protein KGN84_09455 [Acidobacteriota bacterium]|nr:hypothetical protein [Acidobacteriota bacterium]
MAGTAFAASPAPFRLDPGEFRWIPFTVNQIPTEVDSHFQVIRGEPAVHMELLPMAEFRQFNRGREHETLAVSGTGRAAGFRRVLDSRGQYVVVVINESRSTPALVTLEVRTDLNPNADVIAKTISPQRRLAVILISFALFFATVTWTGIKLLRAVRA